MDVDWWAMSHLLSATTCAMALYRNEVDEEVFRMMMERDGVDAAVAAYDQVKTAWMEERPHG